MASQAGGMPALADAEREAVMSKIPQASLSPESHKTSSF
jgi:hypothetical protein